jgi:hypothetical protein
VYVGGIYTKDLPETESLWKFYPKITKQEIHLHVYSKQPREVERRLKKESKADPYFHYEGYLPHKELMRELSKYDYGIQLFGYEETKKDPMILKVAFGNKIFDYLSAGIPVIYSTNLTAVKEFVEKNRTGLGVPYSRIRDLKKYLRPIKIKNKRRFGNPEQLVEFIEK